MYIGNNQNVIKRTENITLVDINPKLSKKLTVKEIVNKIRGSIARHNPQVILIDNIYIINTPWVLKEIRKYYFNPIIVITNEINNNLKKLLNCGATDYMLDDVYNQYDVENVIRRSKASLDFNNKMKEIKKSLALAL